MAGSAFRAAGALGFALAARVLVRPRGAIDLDGRVALVTGGSRGLGLAIAAELARRGARVAVCGRDAGVLPSMRRRGNGTIVNVTSVGGKVAVPHLGSYTPAKFAAVGFSQSLRAELAKEGIAVLTVVPGLMRTGSYLQALYKGNQRLEYTMFSPIASSPLNTVGARRAAAAIVRALERGEPELILGLHAKLLARAAALAPGFVADALGLVNRVLPETSEGGTAAVRGADVGSRVDRSVLTVLGRRAAKAFNQLDRPSV